MFFPNSIYLTKFQIFSPECRVYWSNKVSLQLNSVQKCTRNGDGFRICMFCNNFTSKTTVDILENNPDFSGYAKICNKVVLS